MQFKLKINLLEIPIFMPLVKNIVQNFSQKCTSQENTLLVERSLCNCVLFRFPLGNLTDGLYHQINIPIMYNTFCQRMQV